MSPLRCLRPDSSLTIFDEGSDFPWKKRNSRNQSSLRFSGGSKSKLSLTKRGNDEHEEEDESDEVKPQSLKKEDDDVDWDDLEKNGKKALFRPRELLLESFQ